MKCPRCRAGITTAPDPGGFITCEGCGARLRSTRTAVAAAPVTSANRETAASRQASMPDPAELDSLLKHLEPEAPAAPSLPDGLNPNATLPPGTPLPRIRRPGEDTAKVKRAAAVERPSEPSLSAASAATLDAILAEIREVHETQLEILSLLRTSGPGAGAPSMSEGGASFGFPDDDPSPEAASAAPPVRTRRRKSVLLIDDDQETREAAVAALQTAEVPVRAVSSGNASLAAIAEAKPDVIVMELGMGGEMGGKDVVNMIKATMEWVDIPIVLYTRLPIESQKEARTIHGADELILKSGGPAALVARVITIFRKG